MAAEEGAPIGHEYKGKVNPQIIRKYEDELMYIKRLSPWKYEISKGFVHGMNVTGTFYLNNVLEELMFDELRSHCTSGGYGGFLPAVKQLANVAALPGIVKSSIGNHIKSISFNNLN
jgi:tRNA-splicing ligase RtcB